MGTKGSSNSHVNVGNASRKTIPIAHTGDLELIHSVKFHTIWTVVLLKNRTAGGLSMPVRLSVSRNIGAKTQS